MVVIIHRPGSFKNTIESAQLNHWNKTAIALLRMISPNISAS
jgi:hypothetical protein